MKQILSKSRYRLISGFIAGLFTAVVLYAFLYMTREVFRVLSVTPEYDVWILTDKEVHFYNLIFAFWAVIGGQSACFRIWFDKPRNMYERKHYRKTIIVNDQRFLNWQFLAWFARMASVYFLLFCLTFNGSRYVLTVYPDYNYLFILLAIVLFLQSWVSIRLVFKRKSLKWLLISAVVLSVCAWGLSKVNLIDYNGINELVLRKNVCYTYNIRLPESDNDQLVSYVHDPVKNIYVTQRENSPAELKPVYIVDNKEVALSELTTVVTEWRDSLRYFSRPVCRLFVDKDVKMVFVDSLETELNSVWMNRIFYAVASSTPEHPYLLLPVFTPVEKQKVMQEVKSRTNIIEIKDIEIPGYYNVNNALIAQENLIPVLKDMISYNTDYAVFLKINDLDFKTYVTIISAVKKILYELRDEYAQLKYYTAFNDLLYDDREKVRDIFPFIVYFNAED